MYELRLNTKIMFDGDQWTVAGIKGAAVHLQGRKASAVILLTAVLAAPDFRLLTDDEGAPVEEPGPPPVPLDALPKSVVKEALRRAELVTLMRTGYRLGQPRDDDEQPDSRYDPSLSLKERQQRLADDERVSVRQVQRWVAAMSEYGPAGLVDGRYLNIVNPLGRCDPLVRAAILAELAEEPFQSKVTDEKRRKNVERRLRAEHGETAPPVPPRSTFSRYLRELSRGKGRHLSTKTMRGRANSPAPPYGRFIATRPFQIVQIDSTPLDAFAYFVEEGWCQVVLTLAIDVYTRSIVGWLFTPGAPKSVDVLMLLHDIVKPKRMDPSWPSQAAWRYPGVPESVVINVGEAPAAGVPFGLPESVLVDHGKVFTSGDFREGCRVLGIDIMLGRPYTPTDKPQVERHNLTARQFVQELPGYKGADVFSRGSWEQIVG